MISNLQVLRALAALGVVVYHTNIRINGVHSDLMGVAIFFVISGFIMVHITRENADDFLVKRLIRIVPLYWILTLAAVAWFGFGFANPPYTLPTLWNFITTDRDYLVPFLQNLALSFCTPETAMALLRSLTFWPTAQNPLPILSVGWTLNIEMFFYVLFALSLRIDRARAPLFACITLVALFLAQRCGLSDGKVLATFGHDYVMFFVFGVAAYYLWRALEPMIATHRKIAVLVATGILVCWPLACFAPPPLALLPVFMPPAVVLAALVLHSAKVRVRSWLLIDLGGASYSLYLIHVPVLETLRATSAAFPILTLATPIGALIAALASCAVAMLIYYKLEMPMLRYLHSRRSSWVHADSPVPAAQPPQVVRA
ncbi:exopolysaccharide production protein ExoZ [Bradyrhizobium diazoefficiens]